VTNAHKTRIRNFIQIELGQCRYFRSVSVFITFLDIT